MKIFKKHAGSRGIRPILKEKGPFSSKKGVSTWISWVLLVTFVIFIGTTIFYWMRDYATDAMTQLGDRLKTSEK